MVNPHKWSELLLATKLSSIQPSPQPTLSHSITMRYFYPALQTILLTPISSRAFSSTTSVSSAFLSGNSHHLADTKNKKYPSSIENRQQILCNMSTESDTNAKNLVVDPFCFRQFAEKESSKGYAGAVL